MGTIPSQQPLPPLDAFLVSSGFESALEGELQRICGRKLDGPQWPSVRASRVPLGPIDPVFARQRVPNARLVRGSTVQALAEAAWDATSDALGIEGPSAATVVHTCVPDPQPYRTIAGHVRSLETAFVAHAQSKGVTVVRPSEASVRRNVFSEQTIVQLILVGRTVVLASVAKPRALSTGGFDLVPYPGGLFPVAEDKRAPSRAYRKLRESFGWIGDAPKAGETCVDLGGAPGGWAYTALSAGARVTAVDRSPLSPPALGHEALTMVVGNAFSFVPEQPVDWLLCDVICEPQRTLELVERWMQRELARTVVATLKFKGDSGYGVLSEIRERLAAVRWSFLRIKHMQNHHNEAVILARK